MASVAVERAKLYQLTEAEASEDASVAEIIQDLGSGFIDRAGIEPPAEGETLEIEIRRLGQDPHGEKILEEMRIVQRGTLGGDGLRPTEIFMRAPGVGMLSGDSHRIQVANINRHEGPSVRASLTFQEPPTSPDATARISKGTHAIGRINAKGFLKSFRNFPKGQTT